MRSWWRTQRCGGLPQPTPPQAVRQSLTPWRIALAIQRFQGLGQRLASAAMDLPHTRGQRPRWVVRFGLHTDLPQPQAEPAVQPLPWVQPMVIAPGPECAGQTQQRQQADQRTRQIGPVGLPHAQAFQQIKLAAA